MYFYLRFNHQGKLKMLPSFYCTSIPSKCKMIRCSMKYWTKSQCSKKNLTFGSASCWLCYRWNLMNYTGNSCARPLLSKCFQTARPWLSILSHLNAKTKHKLDPKEFGKYWLLNQLEEFCVDTKIWLARFFWISIISEKVFFKYRIKSRPFSFPVFAVI